MSGPHHVVHPREMDHAERRARAAYARAIEDRRVLLSSCHIPPRYAAEWSERGAYLAVKAHGVRQAKVQSWRRGTVRSFSFRSRTRLLRLLAQCDRQQTSQSLFVTLTYPRSFPTASSTYKRHLEMFAKRLLRRFPRASAIWKLEFQSRGAPHYHLIILGVNYMAHQWVNRQWSEIISGEKSAGKKARTEVRRVEHYRRTISYAAKYVAKVQGTESAEHPGRYWGIFGRESLPCYLQFERLSERGFHRLARTIRKLIASRSRGRKHGRFAARWAIVHGERAAVLARWASAVS